MARVLLEDERVMYAVGLAPTNANLDIVREAGLQKASASPIDVVVGLKEETYAHGSMKGPGNLVVLL